MDETSDQEFERFLLEDEESLSTSNFDIDYPNQIVSNTKVNTKYHTSASSVNTIAAAAKLLGKNSFEQSNASKLVKNKDLIKNKKSKNGNKSREEDINMENDPYAFDLNASVHSSLSAKEKKRSKAKVKKEKVKNSRKSDIKNDTTPKITLDERIAKILQRTGSSNTKVDLPMTDDSDNSEMEESKPAVATPRREDEEEGSKLNDDNDFNENGRLILSNSNSDVNLDEIMGITPEDFEVGAFAKRRLQETKRIFTTTERGDKQELTHKDEYEEKRDADFEPFVSEYEKMKDIFNKDNFYVTKEETKHDTNASELGEYDEDFDSFEKSNDATVQKINQEYEMNGDDERNPTKYENEEEFEDYDDVLEVVGTELTLGENPTTALESVNYIGKSEDQDHWNEYEDDDFEISNDENTAIVETPNLEKSDDANFQSNKEHELTHTTHIQSDIIQNNTFTLENKNVELKSPAYESENLINQENSSIGVEVLGNINKHRPENYINKWEDFHDDEPPPLPPPSTDPSDDEGYEDKPEPQQAHAKTVASKMMDNGATSSISIPILNKTRYAEHEDIKPKVPPQQKISIADDLSASSDPSSTSSKKKVNQINSHDKVHVGSPLDIKSSESDKHKILIDKHGENVELEDEDLQQFLTIHKTNRSHRMKDISKSLNHSELMLKLQQAQRQILQLRQHIQEDDNLDFINTRPHSNTTTNDCDQSTQLTYCVPPPTSKVLTTQSACTTCDQLQNEITTQERLILAYQRENESAVNELKKMQSTVAYNTHKENQQLRLQMNELRTRLQNYDTSQNVLIPDVFPEKSIVPNPGQYKSAVEARLLAESRASAIEEEYSAFKYAAKEKEIELVTTIDRLRASKKQLECQYEGVNVQELRMEAKEVEHLKEELAIQKSHYEHSMERLQAKIQWYIENQRLIDEQEEELTKLRKQVTKLENQRSLQQSPEKAPTSTPSPSSSKRRQSQRSIADVRKIRQLEMKCVELENVIKKRYPDSVTSLLLVSKQAEENTRITEMETLHAEEIAKLKAEIESREKDFQLQINKFRQQQEKIVLRYQKQLLAKEQNAVSSISNPQPTKTTAKHTSKQDVARVRRFYVEKLKEVERKWEQKYQSLKREQYKSPSPRTSSESRAKLSSRPSIKSLEMQLAASEKARLELIKSVENLQKLSKPVNATANSSKCCNQTIQCEIKDTKYLDEQSQVDKSLQCEIEDTKCIELQQLNDKKHEEYKKEREYSQDLMKKYELQVSTGKVEIEKLQQDLQAHNAERITLQAKYQQALLAEDQLHIARDRIHHLEAEILHLKNQLLIPQTPSMVQLHTLEMQIETLNQKYARREEELRVHLLHSQQSNHLQALKMERIYHTAIAQKNAEILTFKNQLDELLQELQQEVYKQQYTQIHQHRWNKR